MLELSSFAMIMSDRANIIVIAATNRIMTRRENMGALMSVRL
jgi:hypothetical protein